MSSSSGLTFKLHPRVIVNISDHHTRIKAQTQGAGRPPRVYGCVLGVQTGRTVEIFNSFELLYDAAADVLDRLFLETKQEQYKKVFPKYDVLGWYSTGSDVQESDMNIHKALMDINESPVYVLLNPTINHAQKDHPISIFESELHVIDEVPSLIFVDASYTIETTEAERISVDHVAHIKPPAAHSHSRSSLLTKSLVLVLDFGSQYTHLITRRIRQLEISSVCKPAGTSLADIQVLTPAVIILSGGPHSVHLEDSPTLPEGFFDYTKEHRIPVLGICYGLHLIVKLLGGEVKPADHQEYGRMQISSVEGSRLYGNLAVINQTVWMSHGDEAVRLPQGFKVVANSLQGNIAAIESAADNIFALQYHPEVTHSEKGTETLGYFLLKVCSITADWKLENVKEEEIEKVKKMVGPDDHAICALSGGVDSAVAATLVHRAIGDRLHCVFVDNGLCRYKERERIMATFEKDLHLPVTCVDASEQFLSKLKGVVDPERKRKIIGAEFIAVFDEYSHRLEREIGKKPTFLVQGTLYPDVIESCPPPGSGKSHSHTIKSHHNVGGLPKDMQLKLIEPLKWLFKDEVRALGKLLGVPASFVSRHPFPGPGLAVRIMGDVTQDNALETIRLADEIFINSIREAGLYDKIWQAFAVYLPVKTVGVQGDKRTHSHAVALRAITSEDGMTADWYHFDGKFLAEVSSKICNSVRGINRVVYDITSKPPSTVEWE